MPYSDSTARSRVDEANIFRTAVIAVRHGMHDKPEKAMSSMKLVTEGFVVLNINGESDQWGRRHPFLAQGGNNGTSSELSQMGFCPLGVT